MSVNADSERVLWSAPLLESLSWFNPGFGTLLESLSLAQTVGPNRFGSRHKIAGRLTNRARQPAPIGVPTPRVIVESVDVHRLVQS